MVRKQYHQGMSIIEILVALAIVTILAVTAIPPYITYLQTSRLTAAAQNIYYTLQYARNEAIKRSTAVYVSFTTGSAWCVGINPTSACTCGTASNCSLGTIQAPSSGQLTLSAAGLTNNATHFEANHGATYAGSTITLTNQQGNAVSVQIGLEGSLSLCSATVSGYQACQTQVN